MKYFRKSELIQDEPASPSQCQQGDRQCPNDRGHLPRLERQINEPFKYFTILENNRELYQIIKTIPCVVYQIIKRMKTVIPSFKISILVSSFTIALGCYTTCPVEWINFHFSFSIDSCQRRYMMTVFSKIANFMSTERHLNCILSDECICHVFVKFAFYFPRGVNNVCCISPHGAYIPTTKY